jgi:hypothetical protein
MQFNYSLNTSRSYQHNSSHLQQPFKNQKTITTQAKTKVIRNGDEQTDVNKTNHLYMRLIGPAINVTGNSPQALLDLKRLTIIQFKPQINLTSKLLNQSQDIGKAKESAVPYKSEKFRKLQQNFKNTSDTTTLNQLMAKSAYMPFQEGDIIKTSGNLPDYKLATILENKNGLRALYFVPLRKGTEKIDPDASPILSFRGTVPRILENVKDDLRTTIGSAAFKASRNEIKELINNKAFKEGVTLVGHSLGGALAQRVAAEFVMDGNIKNVSHYNAPGVSPHIFEKYNKGLNALKISRKTPPTVTNTYDKNDIIRHAGIHLPSTERHIFNSKRRADVAHSMNTIINTTLEEGSKPAKNTNLHKKQITSITKRSFNHVRVIINPMLRVAVSCVQTSLNAITLIKQAYSQFKMQKIDQLRQNAKLNTLTGSQ